MLKTLKKILPALLALALAFAALAGCAGAYTSSPLGGNLEGEVSSNGGFAVQKGEYVYFINGIEDYSADNTYGSVEKGALVRIAAADLAAGNYAEIDTVVPLLAVAQDHTSGVYIYGDTVYYATPNVLKNMDGEVDSSYLDFKSSKLDGSKTMREYYVQVSDNTTVYRYVQEPESGDVYLVYVDASATEIHAYNTVTGENRVLVSGYDSYILPEEIPNGEQEYTIYYTMPVATMGRYDAETAAAASEEGYQQLYAVSAFATETPYQVDGKPFTESEAYLAAYTDKDAAEDAEDRVMEYVNFGTLVLDGIGSGKKTTPFNHDKTEQTPVSSLSGYTYSFIAYTGGALYFSATGDGNTFVYRLDEEAYAAAVSAGSWNSVTANPSIAAGGAAASGSAAIAPIAISTGNVTSSALYYTEQGGAVVYIYVDANGNIMRNTVDAETAADGTFVYDDLIKESVPLARAQSGATLLFRNGNYLYYSMSGTNGNALYRIDYTGEADAYNALEGAAAENDDYKATKYLGLEYSSSWYDPEILSADGTQYLLFANADTYADGYIYAMENPADNEALAALNEKWEDVQELFDSSSDFTSRFADAANAAHYYFYTADGDLVSTLTDTEEAYAENYSEEEIELIRAFITPDSDESKRTLASYRLDFSALYETPAEGETVYYNTESAFFNLLGTRTESDEEAIADSLAGAYLQATAEEETSDTAWTWQWAAIFVPVGVVVIGAIVGFVLVRRRRYRR